MNFKSLFAIVALCIITTYAKAQVEEPPPPSENELIAEPVQVEEMTIDEVGTASDVGIAMAPADMNNRIAVRIVINSQGKVTSAKAIPGRSSTTDSDILRQAETRARGIVYEASKTTKPDERVVFVRIGDKPARYNRYR